MKQGAACSCRPVCYVCRFLSVACMHAESRYSMQVLFLTHDINMLVRARGPAKYVFSSQREREREAERETERDSMKIVIEWWQCMQSSPTASADPKLHGQGMPHKAAPNKSAMDAGVTARSSRLSRSLKGPLVPSRKPRMLETPLSGAPEEAPAAPWLDEAQEDPWNDHTILSQPAGWLDSGPTKQEAAAVRGTPCCMCRSLKSYQAWLVIGKSQCDSHV